MSKKLKADAESLRGRLGSPDCPYTSLRLEEGQTVTASFPAKEKQVPIKICFLQPDSYPHSAALAFCEEDDCLSGKLEEINEYFEERGTVGEVLAQVCKILDIDESFFTMAGQTDEEGGSDGVMDASADSGHSDDDHDMAEADDEERMKEVLQASSRWQILENTRLQEDGEALKKMTLEGVKPNVAAQRSADEALALGRQLFGKQEAFRMLANELVNMMRNSLSPIMVEPHDYDVFHLRISLREFSPESPLAQDMKEVHRRYGYGDVQLDLRLKRGLHPFYPAAVELIRPRFRGPVAGALASHPMLRLSNWDPWRTLTNLSLQILGFLEAGARVDVESSLNNAISHPVAAYTRTEQLLARLEGLCGMSPVCLKEHRDLYSARDTCVDAARIDALEPDSKRPKKAAPEAERHVVWAAGTGYGTGSATSSSQVWDPKQSEAAQAARDAEVQRLLADLAPVIAEITSLGSGEAGSSSAWDATATSLSAIEGSCLVPFLSLQLTTTSFPDMCARAAYFKSVLEVAKGLATRMTAHLILRSLDTSDGPAKPFIQVVEEVSRGASQFLQVLQTATKAQGRPGAKAEAGPSETTEESNETSRDEERSCEMAKLVEDVTELMRALLPGQDAAQAAPKTRASSRKAAPAQPTAPTEFVPPNETPEAAYCRILKPLQVDFISGLLKHHCLASKVESEAVTPRQRTVRLAKELAGLANSLPLDPQSSVFVRCDEQQNVLWKALIVGPERTPYEGGCFEFDFYFPASYPHGPPEVQLRTTGGGSVRFNPNLYNCGKVCLSLLGTWSGTKGEGWDAQTSTALQVLVSIQSLILVDDPYYNEPGYETRSDRSSSDPAALAYNQNIREQTLHWAIFQQLKSPSRGFEEVIRKHFQLRGEKIFANCERWISENPNSAAAGRMRGHLKSARKLVADLA